VADRGGETSGLIYRDQAFNSGKRGEYPEGLETYRTTEEGLEIFLRPVKITMNLC